LGSKKRGVGKAWIGGGRYLLSGLLARGIIAGGESRETCARSGRFCVEALPAGEEKKRRYIGG